MYGYCSVSRLSKFAARGGARPAMFRAHVPEPPGRDPDQAPEIPPPRQPDEDIDLPPRENPAPVRDPEQPIRPV